MTHLSATLPVTVAEAPSSSEGGDLGMFTLLRRWQTFLEVSGTVSESTRRQYVRYVIAFLAETLLDLRAVTEDDIVSWLASRDGRGATRGSTLRALKSFYRWAVAREIVGVDPTRHLRIARPKYGTAPTLSPDELEAVLVAAENVDPRARWALQLAYATGCRVGSLCSVMPADVDLERGWIEFRQAKGDKPYGVPLGSKGREAVQHLLELSDYHPPTASRRPTLVGVGTGSVWLWARRAGEAVGIKAWPHLLRHVAITRLASDPTVAVRTIVELANWQDASLLRRYAAPSDPNLRAAVELL